MVFRRRGMKFYVAGSWKDRNRCKELMGFLESLGHTITTDWTETDAPVSFDDNPFDDTSKIPFKRDCAVRDTHGAQECDVFIVLGDGDFKYGGALVELGIAIASGIAIWLVGDKIMRKNHIFYYHPLIKRFDTVEGVRVCLKNM